MERALTAPSTMVGLAIGAFVLTLVELAWEWRRTRTIAGIFERISNWLSLVVGEFLRALTRPVKLAIFTWAGSHAIFSFEVTWPIFLGCYVLTDFFYYVITIFCTRPGSDGRFIRFITPRARSIFRFRIASRGSRACSTIFFLPLVIVGFPAKMVLFAIVVNLFSQIWIHSEMVGALGPEPIRVQLEGLRRLFAGTLRIGARPEKKFAATLHASAARDESASR